MTITYTTGELALKLNISIHTVRYYEKQGLLPKIKRNKVGNRMFLETDFQWIYLICRLREVNIPISEIKEYIKLLKAKDENIGLRYEIVQRFKQNLENQKKQIDDTLKLIKKKETYYANLLQDEKQDLACWGYEADWNDFLIEGKDENK